MGKRDLLLSLFKCVTDHVCVEEEHVEGFSERDHCIIINFLLLLNANNMLSSCFDENLAYELRVARCDHD